MDADRSGGMFGRLGSALGRRAGFVAAAALAATIAGAAAWMVLPRTYRAETRLEVSAVGGLNGDEYLKRVQATDEELCSRDSIAEVAKSLGLEAKLAALQDGVRVELGPPDGSTYSVAVSAGTDDPDVSVKVAGALAESYRRLALDRAAALGQAAAEQAGKAAAEAKETLDRAAAEHADYVKANREFLEGAKEKLQATRERRAQLKDTVEAVKQQRQELADLIAKEKQFLVVKTKQDGGPDVEQRVPNEQWTKLDEALRAADSRLNAAAMEMRETNAQEKDLEALAKRTPEHETKAAALADAEAAARKQYEARSQEVTKAESALADLRARGSLSVRAVDPPERPTRPSGPGALVFALAGFVVGAAAGVAVAAVRAAADCSFRDVAAVSEFLGVPVLGAVRVIRTPSETAQRLSQRRRRLVLLTALGVFAALTVVCAAAGGGQWVRSLLGAAGQGGI